VSGASGALAQRIRAVFAGAGELAEGDRVVVAFSGGLDSTALLHALRFGGSTPPTDVVAAHFDHGMREGSRADADWVVGLCRAWGVELRVGTAEGALATEEEARRARYEFLEAVRLRVGARLVLTAHHADDQAETVLFRLLRGTGPLGMAGIPVLRDPGILRPLLDVWREDLEEYARTVGLSWREDPTNESRRHARNVLRRSVIPEVERDVAPGARRALHRLAELAREDEAGWNSLLPEMLDSLDAHRDGDGRLSVDHGRLAAFHPAVRARLIRALAERVGLGLDASATRRAVDFVEAASSGASIDLRRSVILGRDLDRVVLGAPHEATPQVPLVIPDVGPGSGEAILAGDTVHVSWGCADLPGVGGRRFDPEALRFPLMVRSRGPGDRIRLPGGTKKVKKLLLERRIPVSQRDRVALIVDAEGDVLWIPGVAGADLPPLRVEGALRIGVR